MLKAWLPVLLLAGCTVAVPPAAPIAPDMAQWYRQAAAAGAPVFAVAPRESLLAVTVRRAGLLARLGHDHVVSSHDLSGFASPAAGRADLEFRADQLKVDEPALRHEAGLGVQPSPAAIEGTRTNMLTRVLEAERFPVIRLHAERIAGTAGKLRVTITLHGVTRSVAVPATIDTGPDSIRASGSVQLLQSDFGIVPLSVAGGLIAVADPIDVRFHIVARRAQLR